MNESAGEIYRRILREFILQVGLRIGQCSRRMEEDGRLQRKELELLRLLLEEEGLPVKQLAARLNDVSLSTMTRLLDKLEAQGCIVRSVDAADRRSYRIRLTAAGEELAAGFERQVDEEAGRLLAPLAPDECEQLCRLLRKMAGGAAAAQEQGGGSPAPDKTKQAAAESDPFPAIQRQSP